MGRMKKIVSFALSAALLSSVAITGASAAGAAYVKSDTTTNLTMQQGAVYQFKLTPVNTKQAVLISGNGKSIQGNRCKWAEHGYLYRPYSKNGEKAINRYNRSFSKQFIRRITNDCFFNFFGSFFS